ncbi:ABC transporter ATP-binding protein [Clostridia bacterium]|nr:ABC transporter ATP-binding protein [Clostridia bacterium]
MARNKYDIDEELESPFDLTHLKRCGIYVKKYLRYMVLSVSLSAVAMVLALTVPQLLRNVIDIGIPNGDKDYIIRTALIMTAAILTSVFLSRARFRIMARVGQSIIADIRQDVFVHLQKLSFNYFDSRPHGKILVRVVQYVNSVSNMLSNGLIDFFLDLLNIIFITFFMFFTNVRLSLFILAGLPFFVIVMSIISPIQRRAWQSFSNKNSNLVSYVQENINGVKVTQIFTREPFNNGIFGRLCEASKKAWMSAVFSSNVTWVSADLLSCVVTASIYGFAILFAAPLYTYGVISAMTAYCSRFWQPIINLSRLYNDLVNTVAYLERIFELIDETVEIEDISGAAELPKITGEVAFDHVVFEYEKDHPILDDMSFTTRSGERIALVGPTGAGKTTVVNLISRFYDLRSGKVLIDGQDISKVTLHSLRSQMGIMLQDSFVFSGTIADNVRYGRLNATLDEIKAACETVRANEFIEALPQKYDTYLEEGGSNLSQGQKQLISFARTLISDPKILILDEATSSIDTKTEKLLQDGLQRLLENRTSFVIAHRLSTIKSCDRIMYIDDKNIVEQGSHDELLEKKGAYYNLYTAQHV